jgi:hypothetical protein
MRRPINWIVFSISLMFLFVGLALSGCGGGDGDDADERVMQPMATGMLRPVRDATELETSLKSALRIIASAPVPPGGVVLPAVDAAAFSNTYTLEAGVDELDYVRYDGRLLYVAPTQYGITPASRVIRILRTEPASGTATELGSIPIEPNEYVRGMYVADGRLVLLTAEMYIHPYGDLWTIALVWAPAKLSLRVFDVSDPVHPAVVMSARIDGGLVATRRIGDRVILVTRHTPSIVLDPAVATRIDALKIDDLLPQITLDGRTRPLVNPLRCFVTNDERHEGYPVLTTITMISIRNPRDFASTCYGEEASGAYASQTALYLAQPKMTSAGAPLTRIHKFSLTGVVPDYAGSAEVAGQLWSRGQSDFRMSEAQGLLRILTTEWTVDPADGVDHRLFILRQKPTENALEVVSQLPNETRPEEIGKPGEQLFGVRFAGTRAYAVTFRQIDPLYVLDLSNPSDPKIAGRLELPGFSDFLHPVTDELLLGLGRDPLHVKLELFDVSVLAQPQSRGAIVLGGSGSTTEALYERHAFTYLPDVDGTDRLAIPAVVTTLSEDLQQVTQSSLYQFEILGKQNAASAWLRSAGSVNPPAATDAERYAPLSRSFIHGDTVYYVRDGKVWSSSWLTPAQVLGPF